VLLSGQSAVTKKSRLSEREKMTDTKKSIKQNVLALCVYLPIGVVGMLIVALVNPAFSWLLVVYVLVFVPIMVVVHVVQIVKKVRA
jgi:hypothetical protein